MAVAVYGDIDMDTGGIVNAQVVSMPAGDRSYLTGIVDAVSPEVGQVVVSGVTVDFNALMSDGVAPSVGDMVTVGGRNYSSLGVLVAEPY
jgi:hypothetical protein